MPFTHTQFQSSWKNLPDSIHSSNLSEKLQLNRHNRSLFLAAAAIQLRMMHCKAIEHCFKWLHMHMSKCSSKMVIIWFLCIKQAFRMNLFFLVKWKQVMIKTESTHFTAVEELFRAFLLCHTPASNINQHFFYLLHFSPFHMSGPE